MGDWIGVVGGAFPATPSRGLAEGYTPSPLVFDSVDHRGSSRPGVGHRRPRAQVLAVVDAMLALLTAVIAVVVVVAPPFVAYAMANAVAARSIMISSARQHGEEAPEVADKLDELAVANAASGTVEGLGALLAGSWPGC